MARVGHVLFYLHYILQCILFTFQDIIGVPDFKGSMENWGLIIQREEAMSFTPQETAEGFKEYVTMILSRELAHVVSRKYTFS